MVAAGLSAETAGMGAALLVVDDSESFRRTAVTLLKVRGFTAIAVAGKDEAVAEVARARPDAVLMDINLVGASGYEAAAAVRQGCPGARLPVWC